MKEGTGRFVIGKWQERDENRSSGPVRRCCHFPGAGGAAADQGDGKWVAVGRQI